MAYHYRRFVSKQSFTKVVKLQMALVAFRFKTLPVVVNTIVDMLMQ